MTSPIRMCRRLGLQALAACLLVVLAGTAGAGGYALDDWVRNESDWKAFGIGTMTHVRKTRIMDIPGMPAGRRVVFEERRTLVAKNATTATIRVERRADAKGWERADVVERLAGAPVGKVTKVLDAKQQPLVEAIQIEGKSYPCTKYEGARTVHDKRERAFLWVHEVEGVLKYEGGRGAGGASRLTWTVTKLRVTRKLGSRTLVGRRIVLEGSDLSGTMVVSADVPGSVIEETLNVTSGATKTRNMRELLAFEKK